MTAATSPRLAGGAIASVVLHAGLIAAFIFARPGKIAPGPPIYRVQLFAAPEGTPNIGVVQSPPAEAPKVETPPPATKSTPTKPRAAVPKPAPRKTAPATTQSPAKPTEAPKTDEPAPTAGSIAGGRGADVANLVTTGLEFPYPAYTNNIVNVLLKYFGRPDARLVTDVQFVIRRDGSVANIEIVNTSRSYTFDQRAKGAVEAAANAKAFGPLPPGFNEDILPVRFRFSPSLLNR